VPAPTTSQAVGAANPLKDAQDKLKQAADALKTQADTVAAEIEVVSAMIGGAGDPSSCQVKSVVGSFHVAPDVSSVTISEGETVSFAVTGGNVNRTATFVGQTVDKLDKTVDAAGGAFIVRLTAQKGTPGGGTQLLIADQSGNQKTIAVTVQPSSTGAPKTGSAAPSAAGSGLTAFEQDLQANHPEDVEWAQAALTMPPSEIDGKIGPKTQAAIRDHQTSLRQTVTGHLDPVLLAQLKATQPGPVPGAKNAYERWVVTQAILRQIQQKLGVTPVTGQFDQATRDKIAAFATPPGVTDRPAAKDELSPGLVNAIRALP
jgi:peptidoglycan hydrolase-like protein with peptidoglycan-binding domain